MEYTDIYDKCLEYVTKPLPALVLDKFKDCCFIIVNVNPKATPEQLELTCYKALLFLIQNPERDLPAASFLIYK